MRWLTPDQATAGCGSGAARVRHDGPVRSLEECIAAAQTLAPVGGPRLLLGIAGPPAAGKSTLAARVAHSLAGDGGAAPRAVVVPMDGFHLAQAELVRLGRADRKGAPDTFDAHGFVALVTRLRAAAEPVVYAPAFDRALEEPVAGAIPVAREVPLVILEGNYLLLDSSPWAQVGDLLDASWYVDTDADLRLDRLVDRHVAGGRTPAQARTFAVESDEANARLVAGTAHRADAVVTLR